MEYGKSAAGALIDVKNRLIDYLTENVGEWFSAEELAAAVGDDEPAVWHILRHLAQCGTVQTAEDKFAVGDL